MDPAVSALAWAGANTGLFRSNVRSSLTRRPLWTSAVPIFQTIYKQLSIAHTIHRPVLVDVVLTLTHLTILTNHPNLAYQPHVMSAVTRAIMTFFFAVMALFSLVSAVPLSLNRRDVWDPPVTYPTNGTVWTAGQTYNVTWDTSSEPTQVTNPEGVVYLRTGNTTLVDSPLAQGFNLTQGSVNVTIPANVTAGDDYIIVLMGDSGNWSNQFSIQTANSSATT